MGLSSALQALTSGSNRRSAREICARKQQYRRQRIVELVRRDRKKIIARADCLAQFFDEFIRLV